MQILVKVGDKRSVNDPAYWADWRDGQIINIRPDGYYTGTQTRKTHLVVNTQHDFWELVGAKNYRELKKPTEKWLNLKKYIGTAYQGKLPWEFGYVEPASFLDYRNREYYIDLTKLYNDKLISLKDLQETYSKDYSKEIYLDRDFTEYIVHEDSADRVKPLISKIGTIDAGGTFTIGTSQTYSDWSDAIADLPADIGAMSTPGNIILQGNTTEEITESTEITVSLDTDSYEVRLTVAEAHRHSGGAYGNGHRIAFGSYDNLNIDEASGGTLNDATIEWLAIQAGGTNTECVYLRDGGDSGHLILQNCVLEGHADASPNITVLKTASNTIIRNCVSYGNGDSGLYIVNNFSSITYEVYNNTLCDNLSGFRMDDDTDGTLILKNNLCYGNTTDYVYPDRIDTHSKNVSGDKTSPDAAYQDWAGSANFEDYSNNDYRLKATDATLDDGDDLSAIGTPEQFDDDIEDQTRDTWFIGASEYVAAGGGSAALTGTAVVDGVLESEIVTGGQTIIITLTDDTWIAAGTGPIGTDANTQALIDGIDGDVAGGTGWDEKVQSTLVPDDDVVRGSDTECTITLNAAADYAITSDETITVTIPAEVLTGGVEITADATFVVTNETPEEAAPISSVGTITAAGEKVGDLASGIATATFSLKKSTATFTLKKPTATFTLKKPTATFS